MISIFVCLQIVFFWMFLYVGATKIAITFLLISIVFLICFFIQWITFSPKKRKRKILDIKNFSLPKNLLPISSIVFYVWVGLLITGVSIKFSINFQSVFSYISSSLSLYIVIVYVYKKNIEALRTFVLLHVIITTIIYLGYGILWQDILQYRYLHAVVLMMITIVWYIAIRSLSRDKLVATIFFVCLYFYMIIGLLGWVKIYTDLHQSMYIVFIFSGIIWSWIYRYISKTDIHKKIHQQIANVHIWAAAVIFLWGMYYLSWSILIGVIILVFLWLHILYENFIHRRRYIFYIFIFFLIGAYTLFFSKILWNISYIGFVLTALLLPSAMIISTLLYHKYVYEVYILHYASIWVMITYGMYSIFFLRFDILQISLLLILSSVIIFFSSQRLAQYAK